MRSAIPMITAGALCAVLAACGSQVDPNTVAQLNGTAAGAAGGAVGGPGAGTGAGTAPDGSAVGTGTGSGGGTTSTSGGSTTGGSGAAGGSTQGTGQNSATGGTKAGGCDGFKNQTGISDHTITIANVADVSGPVPGIFESAQQATRAYAAYFNSTDDICGRKLDVELLDSRADAGADQQAYTKACDDAFAAVGSMGAFDSGGAQAAESCGLPDIRSTTTTPERRDCSTCFAAQAVNPGEVNGAMPRYFLQHFKDATQHAAVVYINAGAAAVNAEKFRNAYNRGGWSVQYFKGIDVSEFNYAPYVQEMKDKGIRLVVYIGPYQDTVKLLDAMHQQGFDPDAFVQDATIYDQNFVDQAGDNGNGVYAWSTTRLFDDYSVKEMQLYRAWLQQVKPGAVPNYYGLYAWSAARLFVEQAVALGGKLTRSSLVDAMTKVRNWTGNGLHVPQQVGSKTTANCGSVLQLNDGKWRQVSGPGFQCGPLLNGN